MTAAKQRAVLRPHGHLMRSSSRLDPDEDAVTVTAWMAGSFVSQLTQGHVSRGSVLSLRRSYLGLQQAHGLRIFVAEPDSENWALLGPPQRLGSRPEPLPMVVPHRRAQHRGAQHHPGG